MDNYSINPIKLNIKLKQYIGWFIALFFPFAARGIIEATNMPILSAVVYWGVCGVLLRYIMEKRLPYFRPQFSKVKREVIVLVLVTILCGYFVFKETGHYPSSVGDVAINFLLFAVLNGCFEQLVWINIFDLAGCKFKMGGFLASFLYVALINTFYWSKFVPYFQMHTTIFVISQIFIFIIPFIIYLKTRDITIWSVHHIIYNILVIIFTSFGASAFFYFN